MGVSGTVNDGIHRLLSRTNSIKNTKVRDEIASGFQAASEYAAMQAISGDNAALQATDFLMDITGLKGLAKTAKFLKYIPYVGPLIGLYDLKDSADDMVNGILAADQKNLDDYMRRLQEFGRATNPDLNGGRYLTFEEKQALMPKYDYESPILGYSRKVLQDGKEILNGLAGYGTAIKDAFRSY